MEAKWPFFLIVFLMIFAWGYLMATMERTAVMKNWETRRCELPILFTSKFFQPEGDGRTPEQFAEDNFSFCTQSYVDKFMALFMAPIQSIMGKQMNVTGESLDVVGKIRAMMATMFQKFSEYVSSYVTKFYSSVFQLRRVFAHLRMSVQKLSAMAMSMIYMGITLFRGMLNTIQAVIRVVLIVCGIMIGLMIILFFVLFPFIPMIIGALTAVITAVLAMSSVMSGSIALEAERKKGGFCFTGETRVSIQTPDGMVEKSIQDIQLGDVLAESCGTVTAVLRFSGKGIPLYGVEGIRVSGSHLIQGPSGEWHTVERDPRAISLSEEAAVLYCLNTTSHRIPIQTERGSTLFFRDWEEIPSEDEEGQKEWIEHVLRILNGIPSASHPTTVCEIPLFSPTSQIETPKGYVPISSLQLGDQVCVRDGTTTVLGWIEGMTLSAGSEQDPNQEEWTSGGYQWDTESSKWIQLPSTCPLHKRGIHLITESGTLMWWNRTEGKRVEVRDFTEVGYKDIDKTYDFVSTRLRI